MTQSASVVSGVREVTLEGVADAAPWQRFLTPEGVALPQSQVTIVLSAADATSRGVRFQECSLSVRLGADRAFLLQSFISGRISAWVGRRLLRAPYTAAAIEVESHGLSVDCRGAPLVRARLPADAPILHSGLEDVTTRVDLPARFRKRDGRAHHFFARFEGETQHFDAGRVEWRVTPTPDEPVFQVLVESGFTIAAWRVRSNATHSRSRNHYGDA